MNTREKTGAAVPADVVETVEVVGYAGNFGCDDALASIISCQSDH
jgi:hypothetical protein